MPIALCPLPGAAAGRFQQLFRIGAYKLLLTGVAVHETRCFILLRPPCARPAPGDFFVQALQCNAWTAYLIPNRSIR